jgi:hypothetical protein
MKTRILFAITLAGALLCALPNVAMAQSGSGDSQGDQGAAIEGTWICSITPAGAPSGFTALESFTAGGVALATGSSDRTPSPISPYGVMSPLYGSWRQLDNNTYVSNLNFFVFPTSGNAINMFRNYITYRLTGSNTLSGVGRGVTCDVNGDPSSCVNPGNFTINCTRLIAQGASN